ncbi:GntR family transcriptional regulator [Hoeflea sp. TYP-13]|uniref:GntR family transcriptional regulator n=1 Tax=Hoeflea sp. TYP-13 TaxID=3230023 RepID=UPI0034C6C136
MTQRYRSAAIPGDNAGTLPNTFHIRDDQSPWRRRFDHIHLALRQRITTLQYEPGTRIDVDVLSEEFGVSRTPVRNVLQRLDMEGLVRTRHGVGTIVAPLDFVQLRQAVLFRIELASMIGTIGPSTIERATILAMRSSFITCSQLFGSADLGAFAHTHMQVHAAICSVIGNDMLLRIYDEMYFRTARMWFHFLPRQDWDSEVSIFLKDIELTLKAMENNDAKGVGFVTRNSIYNAYVRLEPILSAIEQKN